MRASAKLLTNALKHRWCPLLAGGPSGRRSEFQAQDGQARVQSTEVGGRRSDGARAREDKEIDSEYGVTGVPRGNGDIVTRYPN